MPLIIKSRQVYLKAILEITAAEDTEWASTSALAAHLRVTQGSVAGMLKKLAAEQPPRIEYRPYGGARLTDLGRCHGGQMMRRQALLEALLRQTLEYPDKDVSSEVERLEYTVSEQFIERLAALLGEQAWQPFAAERTIPNNQGTRYER